MAQRPVRLPVVEVPQEPEIVPEQREQPEAAIPQRQGPDLEVLCLFSLSPCVLISHSLPGFLVGFSYSINVYTVVVYTMFPYFYI